MFQAGTIEFTRSSKANTREEGTKTTRTPSFSSLTEGQENFIRVRTESILDNLSRASLQSEKNFLNQYSMPAQGLDALRTILTGEDNIAEFVRNATQFLNQEKLELNIFQQGYKQLINAAIQSKGSQVIEIPNSHRTYTLAEILRNPNLEQYLTLDSVKQALTEVIDEELAEGSSFMQKAKSLQVKLPKESAFASIGFEHGFSGPAARMALLGHAVAQPLSILKRNQWASYDRFSGKHAFQKALEFDKVVDEFLDPKDVDGKPTTKKGFFATDKGKNLLDQRGKVKYTELKRGSPHTKWGDLDDRARDVYRDIAKNDFKPKDILKHADDYVDDIVRSKANDVTQNADKIRGLRKEKRAARYAKQAAKAAIKAKKAKTIASTAGRLRTGWRAISTGFKAMGIAGGPVGLALSLGSGLIIDAVIGELIDTGVALYSGEEAKYNHENEGLFPSLNPLSWGVGKFRLNNLGEGIAGFSRWAAGYATEGTSFGRNFIADGSFERSLA